MELDELFVPKRVALDEDGNQIYSIMRKSEMLFIDTLKKRFDARIWRQSELGFSELIDAGKRRFIALVPERHGDALRSAWSSLLRDLQPPRDSMLAIVKALAKEQGVNRPGAGEQSTSSPLLIDGICSKVTYTMNQAFRAGTIDAAAIDAFMDRRENLLKQYIASAQKAYQHERVANYQARLDALNADRQTLKALQSQYPSIVGRVMSGVGTRVCFWRGAGDSTQHSLQHIAVAVAAEGCEVNRAPHRKRESRLGLPLTTIDEVLLVYPGP